MCFQSDDTPSSMEKCLEPCGCHVRLLRARVDDPSNSNWAVTTWRGNDEGCQWTVGWIDSLEMAAKVNPPIRSVPGSCVDPLSMENHGMEFLARCHWIEGVEIEVPLDGRQVLDARGRLLV